MNMKRLVLSVVCMLVSFLLGASIGMPADAPKGADLAAGYAQADITPSLGVSMPGYFHGRKATGVLDPLLAKVLVLTRGETTVAIVALDLISVSAPVVAEIRGAIERATGIPPGRVFVHATHTHTGGNLSEIKDDLPGPIASAVKTAVDRRVHQARVTLGTSSEGTVAFIRRYLMRDATIRTNPGRGNPAIVRPIGEIDPAVHVLAFEASRTLLVSYGLHLDCIGGTQFSADYPYHLTEAIRESLGRDWNVVFLNACCGNVNHINVKGPGQGSGYEESRRIGRALAKAALEAYRGATPIVIDRIGARCDTVACPVRKVPGEVYEWAKREMEERPGEASKRKFNEPTPARIVALAETKEGTRAAEIIALRIGPVGVVGLPAEVFVEVGRDVKRHSLLDPTWVIGLTGGSMGYLPHPRGYQEGGYEATFASARCAPETGWLWSDTAVRLLKELRDEPGQ